MRSALIFHLSLLQWRNHRGIGGTCPTQLFWGLVLSHPIILNPTFWVTELLLRHLWHFLCRPLKSRLQLHSDDGDPWCHQLGLVNQQMPRHQSLHVTVWRLSSTTDAVPDKRRVHVNFESSRWGCGSCICGGRCGWSWHRRIRRHRPG